MTQHGHHHKWEDLRIEDDMRVQFCSVCGNERTIPLEPLSEQGEAHGRGKRRVVARVPKAVRKRI